MTDPWSQMPPPAPPPPNSVRRGPSAGWFTVPAMLFVLALIAVATPGVLLFDDLNRASDTEDQIVFESDAFVERDGVYHLYAARSRSGDGSCVAVMQTGEQARVTLDISEPFALDDTKQGLPYAGRFTAPATGSVELECVALAVPIVVAPDDSSFLWLGFGILAAVLLGVIAIAVLILLLVLRSRRKVRTM